MMTLGCTVILNSCFVNTNVRTDIFHNNIFKSTYSSNKFIQVGDYLYVYSKHMYVHTWVH